LARTASGLRLAGRQTRVDRPEGTAKQGPWDAGAGCWSGAGGALENRPPRLRRDRADGTACAASPVGGAGRPGCWRPLPGICPGRTEPGRAGNTPGRRPARPWSLAASAVPPGHTPLPQRPPSPAQAGAPARRVAGPAVEAKEVGVAVPGPRAGARGPGLLASPAETRKPALRVRVSLPVPEPVQVLGAAPPRVCAAGA